jgi:hypothetical protein
MSIISLSPLWLDLSAGIIAIILGLAYLARTGAIIKDFRIILKGLQKVLAMTFMSQGLLQIFLGIFVVVLSLFGQGVPIAKTMLFMCSGMLLVLGIVTGATGGQSEYILFRFGQFAQVVAAILILAGNVPK